MIEEIERYNVLAGEIRKLGESGLAPRCEVQGPFRVWIGAAMAYIVDGERVTPEFIKIISRENQLTNHAFRELASRLSALEEQTGELRESFKQFYDRWTMDKASPQPLTSRCVNIGLSQAKAAAWSGKCGRKK